MEDAVRVCLHLPSATGSGAALCRRLRASSRRYHRPTGQIQQPGRTQDWIKLGGKVSRDGSRVRCFTRNANNWADRFPSIVEAALLITATSFLIDGEVVIVRDDGTPRINQVFLPAWQLRSNYLWLPRK